MLRLFLQFLILQSPEDVFLEYRTKYQMNDLVR